jgi:hypothetical protein
MSFTTRHARRLRCASRRLFTIGPAARSADALLPSARERRSKCEPSGAIGVRGRGRGARPARGSAAFVSIMPQFDSHDTASSRRGPAGSSRSGPGNGWHTVQHLPGFHRIAALRCPAGLRGSWPHAHWRWERRRGLRTSIQSFRCHGLFLRRMTPRHHSVNGSGKRLSPIRPRLTSRRKPMFNRCLRTSR